MGAAYDYVGNMQASMGVDAADVNGDGWLDLFATNFEDEHNAYYENLRDEFFDEVAHQRGLARGLCRGSVGDSVCGLRSGSATGSDRGEWSCR